MNLNIQFVAYIQLGLVVQSIWLFLPPV